eukprot:3483740-Amphidinium_carterae.1
MSLQVRQQLTHGHRSDCLEAHPCLPESTKQANMIVAVMSDMSVVLLHVLGPVELRAWAVCVCDFLGVIAPIVTCEVACVWTQRPQPVAYAGAVAAVAHWHIRNSCRWQIGSPLHGWCSTI